MKYRRDIDGLRAVAILLVVIYHGFPKLLPGGFIGVDVFFVISGFLITGIIWNDFSQGHFSYLNFYARRFRRLLPAFFVVILGTWLLGWLILMPAEYILLGKHMMASAGFSENIYLFSEGGYFDVSSMFKPLMHLWSLGVEEQFYLLWPTLLLIIAKKRFNPWLATLVIFSISLALNLNQIQYDVNRVFYGLDTRFWELLAGALIYFFTNKEPIVSRKAAFFSEVIIVTALGALLVGAFLINDQTRYPGAWALIPTLATSLLIAFGSRSVVGQKVLGSRVAVFFGLISYPLYLWHWPLISFLNISEGKALQSHLIILALLLAVVLAYGTMRLVEYPLQRKLKLTGLVKQSWHVIKISVPILLFLILLGFVTKQQQGFPGRFANAHTSFEPEINPHDTLAETNPLFPCASGFPPEPDTICREPFGNKTEVAVWGDSHAEAIQIGFEYIGVKSLLISKPGCPPFADMHIYHSQDHHEVCSSGFNRAVLEYLIHRPEIKSVVLVQMGSAYIDHIRNGGPFPLDIVDANGVKPDSATAFKTGLRNTVTELLKAGKHVVIKMDHPEFKSGLTPSQCDTLRPMRFSSTPKPTCETDRDHFDRQSRSGKMAFEAIAQEFPEAKLYNPTDDFCDTKSCYAVVRGRIVYIDIVHFNLSGGIIAAKRLAPMLGLAP